MFAVNTERSAVPKRPPGVAVFTHSPLTHRTLFTLSTHLYSRSVALLVTVVALAGAASAQGTGTITGIVVDAETGETLPIASVVIPETGFGAAADVNGRFVIENVPARPETYLVRASYTGFAAAELPALVREGETVELRFELRNTIIDEVVVTALGLERNERELGYAVTEIRGEETTVGDNTNVINTLSGKIPGLSVTGQSGAVGGSSRITLRGLSGLSGDNQPLFVVDGVPISNDNISSGTRISGGIDTANRANDINPNDIASVSVLKGGAAAALYGQRARNGVILITTKSGRNQTRADIQVSSSVLGSSPLRLPNFQNQYAPGSVGAYDPNSANGWGPVIAGQTVMGSLLDPNAETVLTAQPDNVSDFYDTGLTTTNSVAFTAGNQGTDFRFGVTNIQQAGIVPSSDLDRTTVNLNGGTQLPNGFSARAAFNYVDTDVDNPVRQGSNNPNVLTSIINGLPRTLDTADLVDFRDETGAQRTLGPLTNNPYFIVNENSFVSDLQRVYGNGTIGYTPIDWLSFTAVVGTDFYTESRRDISTVGTLGVLDGAFNDNTFRSRETDFNGFVTANREFGSQDTQQFSVRAVVGANINQRSFSSVGNGSEGLSVPGLYNYGNADQNTPSNGSSLRRLYGFFGDVTLGYNNYLFLQLTGRNDNSSTLPVENNSYFYPSASLSFVASDAFSLDPSLLSYAKLRASAAQVGSDEAPYQLDFRFFPVESIFGQFGTGFSFPYLGEFVGFEATGTVPPTDLRPQIQTTYTVGTELGLLNDRVTLDVELYRINTTDQIISIPTPQSTGFAAIRTNIGEISNRGIEARMTAETFRIGKLSHNFTFNFTRNRNEVVSLAPGVDQVTIVTGFNTFAIRGREGEPLGLFGTGFLRDSTSGLPIIDPLTGLRQTSTEDIRFGDIDPDFQIGFNNTFRFGPVSLGFLIDWKQGGSVYSETVNDLRRSGLAEETAANRTGTFIDDGLIQTGVDSDGNPTYRPNDVPVVSMQSFWGQFANGAIQEGGIFDATYVKLRELTLGVQIPARLVRRTPFSSAGISVQGRNLALLYSKVPHIDPETNIFGAVSSGSGYEFNNLPATRTFGVNLDLTF